MPLLKIELKKIVTYPTFWVLASIYLVLLTLITLGVGGLQLGAGKTTINFSSWNIYDFPGVWHNLTYVAKWFMIFPAIVVIILVCNEFEYKTLRQGVINGLSRTETLLSKLVLIFFLSLGVALFEVLLILILGLLKGSSSHGSIFEGSQYALVYFIQVFSLLSFAALVAFLLKRSGLAIGLFILYYLLIESIIGHYMPGNSGDYLPTNLIAGVSPNPFLNHIGIVVMGLSAAKIILAVVYGLAFQALIFLLLTVRDL